MRLVQRLDSKVFIYIPSFAGGGAERVFIRLANHLAKMGRGVALIVNNENGPLRGLLDPDVELINLRVQRRGGALRSLTAFLRSRRPSVLLSAMTPVNVTAILARALAGVSTKLITSERNEVTGLMKHWSPWRRAAFRALMVLLYPRAHSLTAVTAGVADDLARVARIPRSRITVLHNPAPDERDVAEAKHAASPHPWLEGPHPVLVAIGRLTPQKGYNVLLDAVTLVMAQRPVRLIVLGDGPQRPELETRAARLGIAEAVDFVGFVDNRLDYLARASVFVLSSDTEGFPNSLLEAVSCDIRVVSTDCAGGGARTILGEDSGVIVPVGDAVGLAKAILAELDRPAPSGTIARLASPFSMDHTARVVLDLIERSA